MSDHNTPVRITAVDHTTESVFVSFANGLTATYHAGFLFSVREEDGNAIVSTTPDPPRDYPRDPVDEEA